LHRTSYKKKKNKQYIYHIILDEIKIHRNKL
jgi:hypothetical protein